MTIKVNFEKKSYMNIIITGASRGVGFALAGYFIKDKSNKVLAISRNISTLEKLKIESGEKSNLNFIGFDLRSGNYKNLISDINETLGNVDVLINNAGSIVNKPIQEIDDDEFERVFDVNVKAPFKLVKELMSCFNDPAHVVNITSMGGFQGSVKFPGLSVYSASKGALNVLTECMAEELKEKRVFINSLALGGVQTEMFSEAIAASSNPSAQ